MVAEVVHYRRLRRTEVQILEVRGNVDEDIDEAALSMRAWSVVAEGTHHRRFLRRPT